MYESLIITIRSYRVKVWILEYLEMDPIPPIIRIVTPQAGYVSIWPARKRVEKEMVIVAEELTILYYGMYVDYLRFKYLNLRVPRYASDAEVERVMTLRREVVREAEMAKKKGVGSKVDGYVYHYHLRVPSRKALKDFIERKGFDKDKNLW